MKERKKEKNPLLQKINKDIMIVCFCCSFPDEYISCVKNEENYFKF